MNTFKKGANKGFSLMELIIGLGIMAIVGTIVARSLSTVARLNMSTETSAATSEYKYALKRLLRSRRTDAGPATPSVCMEQLGPRITPWISTMVSNLVIDPNDKAGNRAKNNVIADLGEVNVLGNNLDFGELKVKRTFLKEFFLLSSSRVFRIGSPGEVSRSNLLLSSNVIRVIVANLYVELENRKGVVVLTQPAPVKIALLQKSTGHDLLDCGAGQMATAISQVEACKALGTDFEYIYDKFDGVDGSGQCYAPLYDPVKVSSFGVANGSKEINQPTGYAPLRYSFCQLVMQGKSYTFPFCTEVN